MPYDFTRYASELVQIVRLSVRPGWRPESPAEMYLQHAYREGYAAALDEALRAVQDETQKG